MMRRILNGFIVFVAMLGVATMVAPVSVANAAIFEAGAKDSSDRECKSSFLGFPAWFDGLPRKEGTCDIEMTMAADGDGEASKNNLQTFIFTIALNVIEIGLRVVGLLAVGYIIYGGFKYLTSAGSADRVTAGRKLIQNALIGLVLSIMSVAIVNLVSSNIAPEYAAEECNNTAAGGRVDANCVGVSEIGAQQSLNGVLNSVYFAAGVTAVIVIIVSAMFYVISQGDAAKVKRGKDGVLYAVVGLVVVLFAFVITNFVIGRF